MKDLEGTSGGSSESGKSGDEQSIPADALEFIQGAAAEALGDVGYSAAEAGNTARRIGPDHLVPGHPIGEALRLLDGVLPGEIPEDGSK